MYDYLVSHWSEILDMLKEEYDITDVSFKTWLLPLSVFSVDDNVITILFSGEKMGMNYIKKKYSTLFKVTIEEFLDDGIDYDIEFIAADQASSGDVDYSAENDYTSLLKQRRLESNLNARYTFDSFVVGNNNNFAHAASLAVAESPAEIYNPLFIYGGAGLGKTHLLQAIGNFILIKNPDYKVMYVTSESFTNELIGTIRNDKKSQSDIEAFRKKYRNIDVLLIDDIQFIIGKDSTQQEFFHTFNTLHLAKKQIIITSDKPPKDFDLLEERLRTRFESGLTVDIQSPDYETRMAILHKKAEMEHYDFSDEIYKYIVENFRSNIRELEGALNKIILYSKLQNKDKNTIDLDCAKDALKDMVSDSKNRQITCDLIINTVADHYAIKPEDIKSKKKSKEISYPRQICMYLCREMTQETLKSIGESLKNHYSTVIYGSEKIAEDLKTDVSLQKTIDVMKKKIDPS